MARLIGIPFRWGGCGYSGVDCTGLIRLYLRDVHGVVLPPDNGGHALAAWLADSEARMIAYLDRHARRMAEGEPVRPGDVAVFHLVRGAGHAGAFVSRAEFLHVLIDSRSQLSHIAPWRRRLRGVWRFD